VDVESGVCPLCATQLLTSGSRTSAERTPSGPDRPPSFRGYRVLRQLGRGGMGAVYLAEEEALGRNVAIKVVSEGLSADAQGEARFLREARTLATIEHPHVVRVYSFGENEGVAFLVMEYVEGETLTDTLARRGRLPLDEALRLTGQIVDALEAAWQRRIIHRDIKPSNILLDSRNQVRVADFGLAKPLDAVSDVQATQSGYLLGTPHYLSPEQAQGEAVDFRSDVYALGIMLFQMLTGERPFEGTTPVAVVAKHLHQPLPSIRSRRPELPESVEALVAWMTAKQAAGRPKSYADLRAAVNAIREGTTDDTTLIGHVPFAPRRSQRAQWLVLLLVVAAFVTLMFTPSGGLRETPTPTAVDDRMVVAIAPFYGPDADSAREGTVMAALIERAVNQRIGRRDARVIGIEETRTPLRDHEAARQLGRKLGANAVIWGQAFVLRNETEIEPHVTIVDSGRPEQRMDEGAADFLARRDEEDDGGVDRGTGPLKLQSEAPNQIELRKSSASGIGDLVAVLAAIHALDAKKDAAGALALLRGVPRTAETLRYEAKALLLLSRNDEARARLEESLRLDPLDAQALATLADIELAAGRFDAAFGLFGRAEATGQPFVSTRGFMQRGRLYMHETYSGRTLQGQREVSTIYLVELDRAGRKPARWSMPGEPARFERNGETVTITYNTRYDRQATMAMRGNAFDRYLWPPVDSRMRVRAMKAGQVIPANFMAALDAPVTAPAVALQLVPSPDPSLPVTLPQLETRLREAIAGDPMQPWHRFFLAATLRQLNRPVEAERELGELLRRDYPGTHHYELASMAFFAERMGAPRWEEMLFEKALVRRRAMPAPAGATTLSERNAIAPFTRVAVARGDPERGWTLLDQARRLSGLSLESDDMVAAVWEKYFRMRGDEKRRAHEEAIVRRAGGQRLNYVAALMRADYATAAAAGACGALLALFLLFGATGAVRVRRAGAYPAPAPLFAAARRQVSGMLRTMPRPVAIVLGTAVIGGLLLALALATVNRAVDGVWIFVLLCIAGGMYILRLLRLAPLALAASLQPRERRLLLAAAAVACLAMLVLTVALTSLQAILLIPHGTADSIGHPLVVQFLERRLPEATSDPASRYVLAAVNHYAGHQDRARELYGTLSADPRVTRNREALERGAMPAVPLTHDDIGKAFAARRSFIELGGATDWLFRIASSPRLAALLGFALLFVFVVLYAVPPDARYAADAPPDGRLTRATMFLVPGLYDLRRGHGALGLATLFAALFVLLPLYTLLVVGSPVAATPSAHRNLPNIVPTQPLPIIDGQDPFRWAGLAVRLAFPYATLFWSAFAVSAVFALVVHAWRIRAMLRA